MIQPLQSNSISFKSTTVSPALKARIEAQKALQEGTAAQTIDAQETPTQPDKLKKKKAPKEKKPSLYERAKKGIVNLMQSCNTAGAIVMGAAKGLPAAAGTLGVISVVGKSITDAASSGNGNAGKIIFGSISNIIKDCGVGLRGIGNFIGNIPENSLKDNAKAFFSPIPRLYNRYLNIFNKAGEGIRTYRTIAAVATLAAATVFSVKFLKEKFAANERNANLEHKTNLGHIK